NEGRGGTWSPSGDIVFAPKPEGPLMRVGESGGEPVEVTKLDRALGERSHRYPQFLPDGRHFLYVGIRPAQLHTWFLADVRGGKPRPIGEGATAAVWSSAGYVLWNENNRILARRFDPASGALSGEPHAIDQDAFRDNFAYPNLTVVGEQLFVQR